MENQDLLNSALSELEKTNAEVLSAGACIITPGDGTPKCVQLTESQCAALKGTWVGGKC